MISLFANGSISFSLDNIKSKALLTWFNNVEPQFPLGNSFSDIASFLVNAFNLFEAATMRFFVELWQITAQSERIRKSDF